MMLRPVRAALTAGASAMLAHRLMGAPAPVNPFTPTSKRAFYFDWGADRAARFVAQLEQGVP